MRVDRKAMTGMPNTILTFVGARPSSALGLTVEVTAKGTGIIVLAGPSSCGKGAIAEALSAALRVPEENHISMGDSLRAVIARANTDPAFREGMGERYGIHSDRSVFNGELTESSIVRKALHYGEELETRFGEQPSQVDWLEYCVTSGLLVPDAWSEAILEGTIGEKAAGATSGIILLDGYPRTEVAARHVLALSERLDIPLIKVIHLSVSKREMHRRALGRKRQDDTPEMLERRYQFYVDHVQPAVELLKYELGSQYVALIDAHQPAYNENAELDLPASVRNVAKQVLMSLGVSRHILDHLEVWGR
ncbi:MAG: nucleoside monophosphate kinase [Deltaproteobacteria bacterium]|nr:nucleoside monophosphate kinase [Deltaproteobacteria bacterium]